MRAALGEGLGSTVERAFAHSSPWTVSFQAQARVLASATSTGLAPRSRVLFHCQVVLQESVMRQGKAAPVLCSCGYGWAAGVGLRLPPASPSAPPGTSSAGSRHAALGR